MDTFESGFTIIDANNTGTVSCTSDSFEGADPSPETAKQCFCDDKKQFVSYQEVLTIQDFYRAQNTLSTTETEIATIVMQEADASATEAAFTDSLTEDDGEAEGVAMGCKLCDDTCAADSEKTLTTEIEKQKTVIKKKYGKMMETNK